MLGCWASECYTGQQKIVYLGVTAVAAASAVGGWGVVRWPAAKCPGRQDRHCLFLALQKLLCTVTVHFGHWRRKRKLAILCLIYFLTENTTTDYMRALHFFS